MPRLVSAGRFLLMATVPPQAGGLVQLWQGVALPLLPDNQGDLPPATQKWNRDILNYLRNLAQVVGTGITQLIIQQATGALAGWQYNTSTHKFQIKTFLANGTVSPWTDVATGGQPVEIAAIVESLSLSGSELEETSVASTYVLEKGSETTADTGCACGGGGGGGEFVDCAYGSGPSTVTGTVAGYGVMGVDGAHSMVGGGPWTVEGLGDGGTGFAILCVGGVWFFQRNYEGTTCAMVPLSGGSATSPVGASGAGYDTCSMVAVTFVCS